MIFTVMLIIPNEIYSKAVRFKLPVVYKFVEIVVNPYKLYFIYKYIRMNSCLCTNSYPLEFSRKQIIINITNNILHIYYWSIYMIFIQYINSIELFSHFVRNSKRNQMSNFSRSQYQMWFPSKEKIKLFSGMSQYISFYLYLNNVFESNKSNE